MQVSNLALDLLHNFESGPVQHGKPAYVAYNAGDGERTIGWGHVILPTERHLLTARLSDGECDALLRADLARFERCVSRALIDTPTPQHQFDAMVCLAFNIGEAAFTASSMLRFHKEGKRTPVEIPIEELMVKSRAKAAPKNAPDQFTAWTWMGGKWLLGLWNRRTAERKLYLQR